MVRAAWKGADDADAIVHVVDAEAQDRVRWEQAAARIG